MFFDIYDGDMCRSVQDTNRQPFVATPRYLLLTRNVDWFGPFTNSTYSCGAMYLILNNLPLAERFKTENVILVGVIPGPREASTSDMNHYLMPLVDDLVEWYTGYDLATAEEPAGTCVRVALLNVACDTPAARKVSGFTSHASVPQRVSRAMANNVAWPVALLETIIPFGQRTTGNSGRSNARR